MVAFRELRSVTSMPPGTSSMLRARRRDVNTKHNRQLDKTSSRGMLYENEDLRLRTININADLERGQEYIKKLRRENEQLRREIWTIRDQYDRLENFIKNKQEQELDEDQSDQEEEYDEDYENNKDCNTLSTVLEEDCELEFQQEEKNGKESQEKISTNSNCAGENLNIHSSHSSIVRFIPVDSIAIDLDTVKHFVTQIGYGQGRTNDELLYSAVDENACKVSDNIPGTSDVTFNNNINHPIYQNSCTDNILMKTNNANILSTQGQHDHNFTPSHTLVFSIQSFEKLAVQEVIDELETQLKDIKNYNITSICLTDDACFITTNSNEQLRQLLRQNLTIRDFPIVLQDASLTGITLLISPIPKLMSDQEVLSSLSMLGRVSSDIERRKYKDVDTGEGIVKIWPYSVIPDEIQTGSCHLKIRVVTQNDTNKPLSIARRKSFRSQININLQIPENVSTTDDTISTLPTACNITNSSKDDDADDKIDDKKGKKVPCSKSSISTPLSSPAGSQNSNKFKFPSVGLITNNNNKHNVTDKITSLSKRNVSKNQRKFDPNQRDTKSVEQSPSILRKFSQKKNTPKTLNETIQNEQESPTRIIRKPSVNFKNYGNGDTMGFTNTNFGENISRNSYRERSNSDASSKISICRRKLSMTGHEEVTKIPWCGCWGIGCC